LSGKGGAQKKTFVATKTLITAREKFLALYNGVAKPIIRGLFHDIGRDGEYKQIFCDLKVSEGSTKDAPEPEATPNAQIVPEASTTPT